MSQATPAASDENLLDVFFLCESIVIVSSLIVVAESRKRHQGIHGALVAGHKRWLTPAEQATFHGNIARISRAIKLWMNGPEQSDA